MADSKKEVLNQIQVPVFIRVLKKNKVFAGGSREVSHKSGRKDEKRWRSLGLVDVPWEEAPGPGRSLHPSCWKSAAYWTTGTVENINIYRYFYSLNHEHHYFAEPI